MKKSRISISDIFVKKLSERSWRLMLRADLADIWVMSGGSKSRVAYGIGQMKNRWIIESIGGGIFSIWPYLSSLLKEREWEGDSIEQFYWQIISLLIKSHAPSGAIIAHEKAMEIHLRNYEIPSRLVLYTRDTDKRLRVGNYDIHFRTLRTGEKSGVKNMYRILSDMSEEGSIEWEKLRYLGLEASLLDVASLRIHDIGVAEDLILRFLRKYGGRLSRTHLGELVQYRYIRAINRIRSLSKTHGFSGLYEDCLDIIKKEGGGCYLNL